MLRRLLVIAGSLGAVTLILAVSGLGSRLVEATDAPGAALRRKLLHEPFAAEAAVGSTEALVRLQAQNAELRQRLEEYEEVRAGAETEPDQLVLHRARIIGRSGPGFSHLIEIDRGAVDGVHRDLAVSVGWTMVGLIDGEQSGRSRVRLITDPNSRIPARLLDADGRLADLGVCVGTGEHDRLELQFVEDRPGFIPAVGMVVVSAGGPGPVPPGLLLGIISSARRQEHAPHWALSLKPLRHLDRVASVFVLRDTRERILPSSVENSD